MASKYGVFGCLTCGEYFRSTLNDSVEQIEMHMCFDGTPMEKGQQLLKLREIIDGEIAKISTINPQTLQSAPPTPPPPFTRRTIESSRIEERIKRKITRLVGKNSKF